MFIPASIQGEPVMLCLDSGATKVTLTQEQYRLIPENRRPPLEEREVYLKTAEGSKVKITGAAQMEVKIGSCCESVEVYVAPLSDNLLGINFLQKTGAVIDFRRLQLIINGEQIDCRTRDDRPLYSRLVTRSETRIPAEHEMIIEVCTADSRRGGSVCLAEPVGKVLGDNGLMIARAVVDANSTVIPMKIMNLEPHEQVLKAGTVLARLIPLAEEDVVNARSATATEQEGSEGEFPEHLRDLLEQCTTELNSDERDFVIEMLIQYQDVFSKGEFDLGRTKLVKHSIDTRDARPIRQPLRRSSPEQRAEVQRQVTELLSKGLIQPSDSPWASPVVLVNKKDGTKRLCLDYRKLNDVSVKDAYPLPRIDDSLDSLGGAKYFSTLDLAAGYWQVEMDEDARQKSAFVTASGLYEWNVLPFGLCNAPSTFERLMDNVLAGLRWEALLVYLDDVIVFGRTIQESVERLGTVFARFRNAGLKLKPSKCALFQKQVSYLGHVVSAEGVHTEREKIEAIIDWPTPVTQTQVRSFMGLAQYYRRFVRGFSEIAAPLYKVTEKSSRFAWSRECDEAFNRLKQALSSAPILCYPRAEGQYILDTDASNYAVGCVLSQIQDGEEKVIAYGSKALKKPERNYCVTRRELLAIVIFLGKYKHYVGGRKVKVRTDHGSLRWLFNFRNPEGQLARWLEFLSQFDLDLEYRPGKRHQNADGLSRRPCKQCGRWEGLIAKEKEEEQSQDAEDAVATSIPVVVTVRETGTQTERDSPTVEAIEVLKDQIRALASNLGEDGINELESDEVSVLKDLKHGDALETADKEVRFGDTYVEDEVWEGDKVGQGEIKARRVSVVPEISMAEIREAQMADETIAPILKWKEEGVERPTWKEVSAQSVALKTYWSHWDMLSVRGGALMKRWESDDGNDLKWLLILPRSLRKRVLDELHAAKTAGHLGREKTLPKVRERYYWVGMSSDVRGYVRQCVDCARKKGPSRKYRAPLQQLRVGAPLERSSY